MAEPVIIEHGDCLDVLARLAAEGMLVDACVTDPPYHLTSIVKRFGATSIDGEGTNEARARNRSDATARLSAGFMGKRWDGGDIAQRAETWAAVFKVMKPGAHLVAFGGTRTYHRMACAIEDAGFEIRDTLAWIYGSGFPKSHNLDGDWEGWGTALKPAMEPICFARKPLIGTVAANVLQHGTGALNIDGCRVATTDVLGGGAETGTRPEQKGNGGWTRPWMSDDDARDSHAARVRSNVEKAEALGRWPANVLHDGSDEVLAAFPDAPGQMAAVTGNEPTANGFSGPVAFSGMKARIGGYEPRNDSGSAARFFYCAKADGDDRAGSKHPTVKPLDLMRWLVRLVTPPKGLVLDPFAGSGTTGEAARLEGMRAILIEREAEYVADIKRRLGRASGDDAPLFAAAGGAA